MNQVIGTAMNFVTTEDGMPMCEFIVMTMEPDYAIDVGSTTLQRITRCSSLRFWVGPEAAASLADGFKGVAKKLKAAKGDAKLPFGDSAASPPTT